MNPGRSFTIVDTTSAVNAAWSVGSHESLYPGRRRWGAEVPHHAQRAAEPVTIKVAPDSIRA